MSEQKTCIRCERPIDRYARMCVYCNWDQSQPYAPRPQSAGPPSYVPPKDNRARNRILSIAGGVALIIAAFVIGTVMHGFEPKEVSAQTTGAAQTSSVPQTAAHRADVTLVPATDAMNAPVLEAPVTSAPPQAPGQEASDATALPSDQYAAVAAKAKAQKHARASETVDPRQVHGRANVEAPRPPATPTREEAPKRETRDKVFNVPMASSATRTEAFPEYKPLPAIQVDHETTARVTLTVGADGRVKDIDIIDPIPGATSKLIEAVQTWRFRPATENGTPVPARVTVTIKLHGNE